MQKSWLREVADSNLVFREHSRQDWGDPHWDVIEWIVCHTGLGRCERVLRFMGREVQGRWKFRMQAVKWVSAKLQGDKAASFCRDMSGREVTGR